MKPRIRYLFFFLCFMPCLVWVSASWAREVVDEMGRGLTIPDNPERIVSLAPNVTEILFDLGLANRIVGVTDHCNYPPEALTKPRVGSYIQINVEQVLALNPDLAIGTADGNDRGQVELLTRMGVPVYVIYPRTIRDVLQSIINIGAITGKMKIAKEKSQILQDRLERVAQSARELKKVRVLMQIGANPFFTVNKGTIQSELITLAGGINVAGDIETRYPHLSMEEVLLRKPEVIIITSMKRNGDFTEEVNAWKRWSSIPAVRNSRIHVIDSDLVDRASPRLFDGLERLFELIHMK